MIITREESTAVMTQLKEIHFSLCKISVKNYQSYLTVQSVCLNKP